MLITEGFVGCLPNKKEKKITIVYYSLKIWFYGIVVYYGNTMVLWKKKTMYMYYGQNYGIMKWYYTKNYENLIYDGEKQGILPKL